MKCTESHQIRLRGPWRLVKEDGGEFVVQTPYRPDATPGWLILKRRFQWQTSLGENETLLAEITPETIEAGLDGRPLPFVKIDGRLFAEIGRTLRQSNVLELRFYSERPSPFEGVTLVVLANDQPLWRPRIGFLIHEPRM